MSWIQKIIEKICKDFKLPDHTADSFRIGKYRITIIQDDPTYSIKIFNLEQLTPPRQITDLYWDDLETSIENTVRRIK